MTRAEVAAMEALLYIVQEELTEDSEPDHLASWHRAIANARTALGWCPWDGVGFASVIKPHPWTDPGGNQS